MPIHRRLSLILLALLAAVPARAEDVKTPYWASIRAGEVNMRAGPGEDYRINWVYHRPQLPIKVLRMMEGWRLVQDPDGAQGWMLARFLTRERSAIVRGKGLADMREQGGSNGRLLWRVEPGVVVRLGDCDEGWCAVTIGERTGYIAQDRLWGAGEP
jgi:SH3-like domain-containing protein